MRSARKKMWQIRANNIAILSHMSQSAKFQGIPSGAASLQVSVITHWHNNAWLKVIIQAIYWQFLSIITCRSSKAWAVQYSCLVLDKLSSAYAVRSPDTERVKSVWWITTIACSNWAAGDNCWTSDSSRMMSCESIQHMTALFSHVQVPSCKNFCLMKTKESFYDAIIRNFVYSLLKTFCLIYIIATVESTASHWCLKG